MDARLGEAPVKRALLISYHFPPFRGSSGVLRPLKFAQHLGRYGWQPTVITVNPRAYEQRYDVIPPPPKGVEVHRVFALDTARHLSIGGRYPGFLALPDRWASWRYAAIRRALAVVKRERPDVIWSTYPIATAHVIGAAVHRHTGIPWVADCRDSMTEDDYPRNPDTRRAFLEIEREMVERAARVVFTAPGTVSMYADRYPAIAKARWQLLPNGFDEEDFSSLSPPARAASGPLTLLHSGVLYPIERDPRAFFTALRSLKARGVISAGTLSIVLRATGHDKQIGSLINEFGIGDMVHLEPGLPYRDALTEMMGVDALLLLQASNCNHQIPAKVYEYMRVARPILALTDPTGDTANQVTAPGAGIVVRLDDAEVIERELPSFLERVRSSSAPIATRTAVRAYERSEQAGQLAKVFEQVVAERGSGAQ
jgi:hypothetical protein